MKTRLKYITGFIETEYDEIWDTCCDHGKLGIYLLQNSRVKIVHFVDCIPSIMSNLKTKLDKINSIDSSRFTVQLLNAEEIKLTGNRALVCICGVGSETAKDIITGLLKNNNLLGHDIILSVQNRTPELRSFLKLAGFKIQKELLCFEGKWAHEIMRISLDRGDEIDLIGKTMFNKNDNKHLEYIDKSIKHYTKKSSTNPLFKEYLDLYKNLYP
ncbi:MAG: tRNA (adenine(22)-N(1))-methyltransferase TrmK [Spirochaetaceae bacterium]